MPADDYFIPTDIDALRMESELLALENTYLKQQIGTLEQELRAAKEREKATRAAASKSEPRPS